jgi:hypothetical protein
MVHNLQHYYAVFLKVFSLYGCGQGCSAHLLHLPKDHCGGFMSAVIHLPLWFPIHPFVFIFSSRYFFKEFLFFSVGVLVPCSDEFAVVNVLLHFIQWFLWNMKPSINY